MQMAQSATQLQAQVQAPMAGIGAEMAKPSLTGLPDTGAAAGFGLMDINSATFNLVEDSVMVKFKGLHELYAIMNKQNVKAS